MTCAEFQRALPYMADDDRSQEEEQHLASCEVCIALVADLRHISECAKLLVPMEDPSPRVWQAIQHSLMREGLAKPRENGA